MQTKHILIFLITPLIFLIVNLKIGNIVIGLELPCACMSSKDLVMIDINNIKKSLVESELDLESISYENLISIIDKEGLELSYPVYEFPNNGNVRKTGVYFKNKQDGSFELEGYAHATQTSNIHLELFGISILPLPFQNEKSVVVPIEAKNVEFSYV
ncbi:hypothetical protein GF362_00580 [Candidatus Dojkabacteria bacterium]|nr:hypothetical protein [Candidatus Dojkabacteria bacterium]